jgi:hypothetical protein
MAWVLVDDNLPNHPKVVQATEMAASAGWLYLCGLCYCRRYHTGGFIPRAALPSIGVARGHRKSVDALVAVGLWDAADGGFAVHDYAGFYADEDDKAAKEETSRQRREAGRRGGLSRAASAKQNADFASSKGGEVWSGSSDHLLEEKKRQADFANFWAAYPRKDGRQAALTEWQRLKLSDEQQKAIASDLERRGNSSQWLKDGGQFIPHARTYLHQRRWEDGFEERPRLSERTINVIKGFEDVKGIA